MKISYTDGKITCECLINNCRTTVNADESIASAQLSDVLEEDRVAFIRGQKEDEIDMVRGHKNVGERTMPINSVKRHNDQLVLLEDEIVCRKKAISGERELKQKKENEESLYMHAEEYFAKDVEIFEKETLFTAKC